MNFAFCGVCFAKNGGLPAVRQSRNETRACPFVFAGYQITLQYCLLLCPNPDRVSNPDRVFWSVRLPMT